MQPHRHLGGTDSKRLNESELTCKPRVGRCRGRIVFRHYRDVIPVPKIDPPRVRTVLVLQSNEELQSAIERARAFERRDEYERRVGAYDRYLNMLAHIMRMPPEGTEEERKAGSQGRVLPSADLPDTPPPSA